MPHRSARSDAGLCIDAAVTAAELAVAAPQVIAARLAMGAAAMSNPSQAANTEALRMMSEKTQAFAEGGLAASARAAEIGAQTAAYVMAEAVAGASLTPFGAAHAAGRFYDYWAGMTRLGLQMQSAAMAPLHKTATANAKRLRS
jgi:hypothetical protein